MCRECFREWINAINYNTFPKSWFHSLEKYLLSFSSRSKNMCSLSGMEKKDNRETRRQLVTKQNSNVAKRKIYSTMG